MSTVSPTQIPNGAEITASGVNTPINQIAAVVNGNLDDNNINSLSGSKITSATIPAAAMVASANPETRFDEALPDFVASGCVWSISSGLNGDMTSGVVYVDGKRATVSAVSARAFTASKDTYVSVTNAGVITYSEVANNAAAPSLPANSTWLSIVITSGAAITAVDEISIRSANKGVIARRTLGAVRDTITLSHIPARTRLRIVYVGIATGGVLDTTWRLNNDSGANYNYKNDVNNAAGADVTGATSIPGESGSTDSGQLNTGDFYFWNHTANEKAFWFRNISQDATGAVVPVTLTFQGKWANTSAQITRIDWINAGAGDFAVGSEIIVFEDTY